MSLQNKAGSIIIDATLTDLGRQYMAKGKFLIKKFALGDDEITYNFGDRNSGEYLLDKSPPTLEAQSNPGSAIVHGLIDFNRQDIMHMPVLKINEKLPTSVNHYNDRIYISVNEETTKKLKNIFDISKYLLENNEDLKSLLYIEGGIDSDETGYDRDLGKKMFIENLGLYDKYLMLYCDSRLIEKIMVTNPTGYIKNDDAGNLYQDMYPLSEKSAVTIPAPFQNQETYYFTTTDNKISNKTDESLDSSLSEFPMYRSIMSGINFSLNKKLLNSSGGTADMRYTNLGETSVELFGDGNKYDYIDTTITIQGCSSMAKKDVRIRIIRFSGT